jgi:DNA-binding CsgD family transcriptional regulator
MEETGESPEPDHFEAATCRGGRSDTEPPGRKTGCGDILDLLEIGVVIFTDRKVVFRNRRAEDILVARDGLSIDGVGALRAFRPTEDRVLQSIIRISHEHSPNGQAGPGSTITISRPSERLPYPVMVKRLPVSPGNAQWGSSPVAAFIRDPDQIGSIPWDAVAETFGLTPTEERLVRCLVEGSTPEETAGRQGINVSTVRWHMKQIFDKTGASRQGDLIRLILSMAMPLRW